MKELSPHTLAVLAAAAVTLAVPAIGSALPVGDYSKPAARDTEPVILTGKDFAGWSVPSNVTAKAPLTDAPESFQCWADDTTCDAHNSYVKPELDSQDHAPLESATKVDRLLGYRWDGEQFVQIPFQVDEMFTRYLDNSASGFAFYSGQDQHTSYAFDREGFRFTEGECIAQPEGGVKTTADPVKGLDDNDELVFMASDAGDPAPANAPLPTGVDELRKVQLTDPTDPTATRVVYVAKAGADGPAPAFDEQNGYVRYERDAVADIFEMSESSYEGYGNARRGTICDEEGNVLKKPDGTPRIERRRPRDYATITTDRYRFRYDGRWLMTKFEISPDDDGENFGPDLIDRWKARAFQQDPSSETPCCGYEEEDTNWGGSSTLLGERSGPVRTIRETWGADSGTNVIRRETFYREEMRQKNYLRVHVIPPLDGIYAQWDFNAGRMTRFYNSSMSVTKPEGVAIDGVNDEVFGNLDDPCNPNYDGNDTSEFDQTYRDAYATLPGFCGGLPYHQSIDLPDPTMSEHNAGFQWNVTAGPHGTIVDRYQIDELTDQSAGGTAQNTFAVPYYRDDSCFDDGTGTNPGLKVRLRSSNEPRTYTAPDGSIQDRKCWKPGDDDAGLETERYFQGSIGTHGLHILMIADSDNARQTVPVTEMVAEQRMVALTGERGIEAGEQYGRGFEKPLVATVVPEAHPSNQAPTASFDVAPAEPQTHREATFTSTSSDADGEIARAEWDLDGDGEFDDATGDSAGRTFSTTGDHTVRLRVTDTSGGTATAEQTFTVTNPAPTVSISYAPSAPKPEQVVTFSASASDPNGSVASYAWDLDGDGEFDDASTATATRTFPRKGSYAVAVRVTDDNGASAVADATVAVGKPRR